MLLAWSAGQGAASFSPTPGGIGVVEVTMTAALVAAGLRPADALAATKKGLEREPNVLIYQVNLAHSLLFLGRYEEAKAVYIRLQDVIDEGKQIPGREVVRNDFMLMRAAGISHPDMPRIEAAIGIK